MSHLIPQGEHMSTKNLFAICVLFLVISTSAIASKAQRILFILSAHEHGYWLSEVLTPYKILNDAGYIIDFATPDGARGVQAGQDYIDQSQKVLLSQLDHVLAKPLSLKNINPDDYAALYVPGGAGPMFDLFDHPQVNRITAKMYEDNKPVSADCHGPAAFAGVRLSSGELMISGKNVTAKSNAEEGQWARDNYPFMLQDKLIEHQASFSAAPPQKAWIIQDGNLLTGQNPQSAEPLAIRLVEMLAQ